MLPVIAANKQRVRNFDGPRPNIVAIFMLAIPVLAGLALLIVTGNPLWFIGGIVVGLVLMQSPKVAKQWEKAVVLRLADSSDCTAPDSSGSCRSSTPSLRGSISA